jgi:hypothetical protein
MGGQDQKGASQYRSFWKLHHVAGVMRHASCTIWQAIAPRHTRTHARTNAHSPPSLCTDTQCMTHAMTLVITDTRREGETPQSKRKTGGGGTLMAACRKKGQLAQLSPAGWHGGPGLPVGPSTTAIWELLQGPAWRPDVSNPRRTPAAPMRHHLSKDS